jgi:para-nitrobenzyl esterase
VGGPVVATRYGAVRGEVEDGIATFLGIPYAGPSAGVLRFFPPTPPEPWSGVLEAREPGPIAPQPESLLGGYVPGDPRTQDEACCSLNVFSPGLAGRRPVLVFIHGGAFLIGGGGGVMYRAEALARRGVVVVTFNYRLGALGFLAHRELAAPDGTFANWGVLDQIAALEFVRDHIASFGGDPSNVTLFGESAGAMSTADLLTSPRAVGLFRRAILESGAATAMRVATAEENAIRFVRALGMDAVDRDALSRAPVADLLDAQAALLGDLGVGASMPFQPVVDGRVLPDDPSGVLGAGGGNAEALLIGTNRDEFRFFTIGQRRLDDLADGDLAPFVAPYLPTGYAETALSVIAAYRSIAEHRGDEPSARALFESIAGDAVFWAPALHCARASAPVRPTFSYRFDWESPFMGGALGACHGLELPFVFGTHANAFVGLFSGTGPEADALVDAVQSAWVAFATDGHPGQIGDIRWPEYTAPSFSTVIFDRERTVVEDPRAEEWELWEAMLDHYGEAGAAPGT